MSLPPKGGRLFDELEGLAMEGKPHVARLSVLMANEPPSYREVIAAVIRRQRPKVEVVTVEPEVLDLEIARLNPRVVVCSQATDLVRRVVPVWVELYPGHGSQSVVSVADRRSTIEDIQLEDLVNLIDEASYLPDDRSTGGFL